MILKECPVCGKKLTESKKKHSVTIGSCTAEDDVTFVKCGCCGFSTSDFKENEKTKEAVLKKAQSDCIANAIENLKEKYSLSEIELALGLPLRTLSKYKNRTKNPSASAVALLQLLQTFPWLVVVAEEKFDKETAYEIAKIAIEKKNSEKDTDTLTTNYKASYDNNIVELNFSPTKYSSILEGCTYEKQQYYGS